MTARAYVAPAREAERDIEPAAPGALAAWQAALSMAVRAVHIGTDLLSPALRRGATAVVDPGIEPMAGDLVEVEFWNGQTLIVELVRRTQTTMTVCTPLARKTYRQFPVSDTVSVATVVAVVPPGRFPEVSTSEAGRVAER